MFSLRICHPASELAIHGWLTDHSGLGELLDYDFENLSLYNLYTISDQLLSHKEAVERSLDSREKSLFGFKETITLYDLTNTDFDEAAGETLLYCHSTRRELKDRAIGDRFTQRMEEDLEKLNNTIRNVLSSHNRITVSMQCKSGNTIHVRKSTRPEAGQQEIYSALGVKQYPGTTIKTTI